MFVIERMSKGLITALSDMKISVARNIMLEKKIRHLPVVDEHGKLLGMVSDRDVRSAMPSSLLEAADYEETLNKIMDYPVERIMTPEPHRVYLYYTIQDVLLIMRKFKVGALPVVDDDDILQGILSTRDLLSAFVDVMGIDEPGTLLCILADDKRGQIKRIVDVINEEKISLGSVLVSKTLEESKKAIFPYVFTNNVIRIKEKLLADGFEITDPMKWYFKQLPQKE